MRRAFDSRRGPPLVAALVAALVGASWAVSSELLVIDRPPGRAGGRLVMALRSEPRTLNPTTALDSASTTLLHLLHAPLIAIDGESLELEPALASSWSRSADGRTLDVELRRDVRFSDGEPFDAEDVLFSFEALLDPANASPLREAFVVGGEPVRVSAPDSHRVRFETKAPSAVLERSLDGVAILPSHLGRKLQGAGAWATAWGLETPPAQMAGLGPFRLVRREPGERLVLARNPHYWKRDAAGTQLPYLEEVEFLTVASQAAQVLRFRAGETDAIEHASPESFASLQRAGADGLVLRDIGPGLSYVALFFNLNRVEAGPEQARRQGWFRERGFRRAVSLAVDRAGIARLTYSGRAAPLASQETPGSRHWIDPSLKPDRRDLDRARAALREAGFGWRDGRLLDPSGALVRFSIMVHASSTTRGRIVTLMQQDLDELGMTIDVRSVDHGALMQSLTERFDYDTLILEIGPGDADPGAHMPTLVTGGGLHLWQMSPEPADETEAELDRLMRAQLVATNRAERKRIYAKVQALIASELYFIPLVSPNELVGVRAGLGNFRPSVLDPHVLWNADELYWQAAR